MVPARKARYTPTIVLLTDGVEIGRAGQPGLDEKCTRAGIKAIADRLGF
ncbi:MAG TPA: hypothetical protein VLA52_10430 [Thermohalobaculum sp.]|nr:hypothetical protein [Thermohalobaculum sp.]